MFTILDYSSALEYSIIRRYTNIVYYYIIISGQAYLERSGFGHNDLSSWPVNTSLISLTVNCDYSIIIINGTYII